MRLAHSAGQGRHRPTDEGTGRIPKLQPQPDLICVFYQLPRRKSFKMVKPMERALVLRTVRVTGQSGQICPLMQLMEHTEGFCQSGGPRVRSRRLW